MVCWKFSGTGQSYPVTVLLSCLIVSEMFNFSRLLSPGCPATCIPCSSECDVRGRSEITRVQSMLCATYGAIRKWQGCKVCCIQCAGQLELTEMQSMVQHAGPFQKLRGCYVWCMHREGRLKITLFQCMLVLDSTCSCRHLFAMQRGGRSTMTGIEVHAHCPVHYYRSMH